MIKKQWLTASKSFFNQTSLHNRIDYINQWGLPKEIQQARDITKQKAQEHDTNIRNN